MTAERIAQREVGGEMTQTTTSTATSAAEPQRLSEGCA